jgi:hypothetical protein
MVRLSADEYQRWKDGQALRVWAVDQYTLDQYKLGLYFEQLGDNYKSWPWGGYRRVQFDGTVVRR